MKFPTPEGFVHHYEKILAAVQSKRAVINAIVER